MIFLPNKKKHKRHHGKRASQELNNQFHLAMSRNSQQLQQHYQIQPNNVKRQQQSQQSQELRRQQASRNEEKKRERVKDTILKVLAFTGTIFLLAGIGLLIFGIVQQQLFGYVSGGVLLGGGAILLAIMVIVMCSSDSSEEANANAMSHEAAADYEMRPPSFSSRTQVTPNWRLIRLKKNFFFVVVVFL